MGGAVVLGPRQAAVLAHLREHPGMTAGELARALGVRGSLLDLLRQLEQRAQVVAVTRWESGQGRNVARWQLAPLGTVPPPPRPPADPKVLTRTRERDRLSQRARRARARGLTVQPGIEAPSLRDRPASAAPLRGAACGPADAVLFFGPDKERAKDRRKREANAAAICAGCPVRAACYARAVANGERWGVWGGISFERKNRTRGRKAS